MIPSGENQNGFTIIELVVVMAIVGIVVSFAAVTFRSMMDNSTSRAAVQKLNSSLVLARVEAIKRGGWVRLCGSANLTSCSDSVNSGWLIYHDVNTSGNLDAADILLDSESINPDRLSVSLTNTEGLSVQGLAFDYRGYTPENVMISASKGSHTFKFDVSRVGRTDFK